MAVYRKPPICPYCGKIIAKEIHKNQSHIPFMFRIIGDTFIRWEYIKHNCNGKRKADKEIENTVRNSLEKLKSSDNLPSFLKRSLK